MVQLLQPFLWGAALYGYLPVTFKRAPRDSCYLVYLGISRTYHPLYSTVLWVCAVQGFIWWSMYRLLREQTEVLRSQTLSRLHFFISVSALIQLLWYILTLLSWAEMGRLIDAANRRDEIIESLKSLQRSPNIVGQIRFEDEPSWSPRPHWVSYFGMTFIAVKSLVQIRIWTEVSVGSWCLAPTLVYNDSVVTMITVSEMANLLRARDVARVLLNYLSQEVGTLRAERLRAYRRVWLRVHDLACRGNLMPCTCMAHIVVLLLLTTLAAYSASLAFAAASWTLFASLLGYTVIATLSILGVNDSAQRLSDEIQMPFLDLLQSSPASSSVDVVLSREIDLFMDALLAKPPSVSVAGFFELGRGTFTAIAASIVTYLVVLIQFQTDTTTKSESAELNATLTPPSV